MNKLLIPALFCSAVLSASVYEITFDQYPYPGKWTMPKQASHDPRGGDSGTGALRFHKEPGDPYTLVNHDLTLKPGVTYKLTCSVRFQNLQKQTGPVLCVEYHKNGKHLTGNYWGGYRGNESIFANESFQEITLDIMPPKDFDRAILRFYLGKAASGTVWYDNVRIAETGAVPPDIYDLSPSNLKIRNAKCDLAFKAVVYQDIPLAHQEMTISANGVSKTVKADETGRFQARFTGLKPGKLSVTAVLKNTETGKELTQISCNYFVTDAPDSANASYIREDGVTICRGEPFLPVGFYCSGEMTPIMVERMAQAGANTVMCYSIARDFNLKNALDLAHENNLKVLFNTQYQLENSKSKVTRYRDVEGIDNVLRAWARDFRNHPAMLGWYISDENPRNELPRLRRMREVLAEADPDHFTVTLTYRTSDFPAFMNTGDIFATDPYPIETTADQSMGKVYNMMKAASDLTPRVWMVPQAFNWKSYREHCNPKYPYRFPTEQEIRSMVLSGAIAGAKGFLFYSYSPIWNLKKNPTAEEDWRKVVPSVKLLRELEGFLISREKAPEVTVESKTQTIRAKVWMNNGKMVVAITYDGPKSAEAIVTVPGCDSFKSRYGFTENLGGGKYRFKAQGISSDILE